MSNLIIPKVFHRIWVGDEAMPKEFVYYGKTWEKYHPDWEMKLWTKENMISLINQEVYDKAEKEAQKADIARYEILYNFGGVYIDCDFQCLKNIEPLLDNVSAFAAWESPGVVCISILGCNAGNSFFKELVDGTTNAVNKNCHLPINYQAGPMYFTEKVKGRNDVVIFDSELFYPYLYSEKHRKEEAFPNAYAVHHWSGSWL